MAVARTELGQLGKMERVKRRQGREARVGLPTRRGEPTLRPRPKEAAPR
jgi:hypothetical protein